MTTLAPDTTYLVDDQIANALDFLIPLYDLKTDAEGVIDGVHPFLKTVLVAPTAITISGGVLTVTQTRHKVVNQGGAGTDDVDTITGTMDVLVLQQNSPGQTIIFKHNTGNLLFEDNRDFKITDQNPVAIFHREPTSGKWSSVNRNTGNLWLIDSVDATIASDTLDATQTRLWVLPESGVADDLSSINNPNNLDVLLLVIKNSGDFITVKHNTGNIWLESEQDETLTGQNRILALYWNDVTSKWTAPMYSGKYSVAVSDPLSKAVQGSTFLVNPETIYLNSTPTPDVHELNGFSRLIKRRFIVDQVSEGTTFSSFGATFTTTGSSSANNALAESNFIRIIQPASPNTSAIRRSGSGIFQYRWSPYCEFVISDIPYHPMVGLMTGTPAVTGPGNYSFTGVSGIFFRFHTSNATTLQVYENGVNLASINVTTPPLPTVCYARIGVDAATNTIYADVNGKKVSLVVSPTTLATVGMDLIVLAGSDLASNQRISVSRMFGEQD